MQDVHDMTDVDELREKLGPPMCVSILLEELQADYPHITKSDLFLIIKDVWKAAQDTFKHSFLDEVTRDRLKQCEGTIRIPTGI